MKRKYLLQLIIGIIPILFLSSCKLQKAEGDIHPEYPDILMRNDSLDLPLKPLKIANEAFNHVGDRQRKEMEEVSVFKSFMVNGEYVYKGQILGIDDHGSVNEDKVLDLYYDQRGNLMKKTQFNGFINHNGDFF